MTDKADTLLAQIINIPCNPYDGTDAYTHYCRGHRDARHAAAELVLAALTPKEQQAEPEKTLSDQEITEIAQLAGFGFYGQWQLWQGNTKDLIAFARAILSASTSAQTDKSTLASTKLDNFLAMVRVWVERDGGDMNKALAWMHTHGVAASDGSKPE